MSRTVRSSRRRVSLRAQLLAMFVIATALIGTLAVLNASNSFGAARRAAVTQVNAESVSNAKDFESSIVAVTPVLSSLVAQPALHTIEQVACTNALKSFRDLTGTSHVLIVDNKGSVLCSDGSLGKKVSIGVPAWLTQTFAKGTQVVAPVSDPISGTLDAVYSVAYTTTAGQKVALVGYGAGSSMLGVSEHNGVDPVLVDSTTGMIFSAPSANQALIGTRLDLTQLHSMLDGTTRTFEWPDGAVRISSTTKVEGIGWLVVAGMSHKTALAPAYRDLNRNLLVGGLIVIVLLGLELALHRQITVPLRRLRRAMEHVAADSVDTRAPESGPAELVDLARSFNEMLEARALSEARFRALAKYDSDFVTVVDVSGYITYANPRASEAFGIDIATGEPVTFLSLVAPADHNHVLRLIDDWKHAAVATDSTAEFRLITRDDETRFVEANVQNLLNDKSVAGLIITCGDITDRKAAEDRLTHAALHDSLTGLPNRPLVMDRLEHVLERGRRDGTTSAVLFLDLDSFKLINDTSGHGAGDTLLVQVAERFSTVLRPGDTLGRFGGDEFVVVCDGLDRVEDALTVAKRLIDTRDEPYTVNGQDTYIGGSIGIAIARPEDTASGLLRDADVAMYRAKAAGRGSICVFDDAMRVATHTRLDIESALLHALDRGQLTLSYQPLIALDDNRPVTLEALLRWTTADGTSIPPDDFIPIAEETGLIVSIGAWVLDEGCRQFAQWRANGDVTGDTCLAINVSARQLIQPAFPSVVAGALDRHGLPADRLVVEITESTVMRDALGSIAILGDLRALGVRISIDDFGTGYSSLGYLQRLPIDELKIDRAFVSPLATGPRASSIVESVVSLGHALGLTVTAEGVETEEQLRRLRRIGCDLAQGFLFARPIPASDVPAWFSSGRLDTSAGKGQTPSATA